MSTDNCSTQPSLKRFVFPSRRDHYRNSQLPKMLKTINYGVPHVFWYICKNTLYPRLREHQGRVNRKILRVQDEGTCCKSLSSRYDNKDVPLKSQQYSYLTKIAKWQHQLAYQMEEKFYKSLLLAEKLQRINDCWKEELV